MKIFLTIITFVISFTVYLSRSTDQEVDNFIDDENKTTLFKISKKQIIKDFDDLQNKVKHKPFEQSTDKIDKETTFLASVKLSPRMEEKMRQDLDDVRDLESRADEILAAAKNDLVNFKNLDVHSLDCSSKDECAEYIKNIFSDPSKTINQPDAAYLTEIQSVKSEQFSILDEKLKSLDTRINF